MRKYMDLIFGIGIGVLVTSPRARQAVDRAVATAIDSFAQYDEEERVAHAAHEPLPSAEQPEPVIEGANDR